jgi:hypothetical protein
MFYGRHRGGNAASVCARTAAHGTHSQQLSRVRELHQPQRQPTWNRDSSP